MTLKELAHKLIAADGQCPADKTIPCDECFAVSPGCSCIKALLAAKTYLAEHTPPASIVPSIF